MAMLGVYVAGRRMVCDPTETSAELGCGGYTRRPGWRWRGACLVSPFMRDIGQNARLIGFVQVHVGARVFALPVQAVKVDRDRTSVPPGGFFFDDAGQFGIIVDGDASPADVQAQITAASAEAVRHISRKYLN